MGTFQVELKKVVDDSYEIEVGFALEDKLIADLQDGLVGKIHKFAVITDSNVKDPYGEPILHRLKNAGYQADLFVFEAGEKSKTRQTKEMIDYDIRMLKEHFKLGTVNVFTNNTTDVVRDEELVRWFLEKYAYLEEDPTVEVLYENTDFGVGD